MAAMNATITVNIPEAMLAAIVARFEALEARIKVLEARLGDVEGED